MKSRRTRRQRIQEKRAKLRKDRKGEPLWEFVWQDGVRVARRPEKALGHRLPGDE